MNYTLSGRKILWVSLYAKTMVLLGILAIGLLTYDYINYGNLMTYVFTGLK